MTSTSPCVNSSTVVRDSVIFGIYLLLAISSPLPTLLIFFVVDGLKKNLADSTKYFLQLKAYFFYPFLHLFRALFLYLAFDVVPIPCAFQIFQDGLIFLTLFYALVVGFWAIVNACDYVMLIYTIYFEDVDLEVNDLPAIHAGGEALELGRIVLLACVFVAFLVAGFRRVSGVSQISVDNALGILYTANALTIAAGYALVAHIRDVLSGLTVLSDRHVDLGDFVSVRDHSGVVTYLGLRRTRLEATDGTISVVPTTVLRVHPVIKHRNGASRLTKVLVPFSFPDGRPAPSAASSGEDVTSRERALLGEVRALLAPYALVVDDSLTRVQRTKGVRSYDDEPGDLDDDHGESTGFGDGSSKRSRTPANASASSLRLTRSDASLGREVVVGYLSDGVILTSPSQTGGAKSVRRWMSAAASPAIKTHALYAQFYAPTAPGLAHDADRVAVIESQLNSKTDILLAIREVLRRYDCSV